MSNRFYTPSPTVNFAARKPSLSPAQQVLAFKQKEREQQREDEKYAMEKKKAQLAYETGMLQLNAARLQMEKVKRDEDMDKEAAQIYNSVIAAGGTKRDAMKSVGDMYLTKGGWSKYEKFQQEQTELGLKTLEAFSKNPTVLAQHTADVLNGVGQFAGSEEFTADSLMDDYYSGQPIKMNKDGDAAVWNRDKNVWETKNMSSPETKQQQQIENRLANRRIAATEARNANAAEKALLQQQNILAKIESKEKMAEADRLLKEQQIEINRLKAETGAKDVESKVATREAKIGQGDRKLDLAENKEKRLGEQFKTTMEFKRDVFEYDKKNDELDRELKKSLQSNRLSAREKEQEAKRIYDEKKKAAKDLEDTATTAAEDNIKLLKKLKYAVKSNDASLLAQIFDVQVDPNNPEKARDELNTKVKEVVGLVSSSISELQKLNPQKAAILRMSIDLEDATPTTNASTTSDIINNPAAAFMNKFGGGARYGGGAR